MCAWLLILCAFCSLGAISAQAVDVTGLGKIAVASGAADWGIGALQQALDAQMSAVYNVSRAVVVGMGAAEMLDATNNFIDSRPETQYLAGRITLPDLVSTWLNEYAREKSIEDLGQIYERLQSGITVDSDGVMYYNGQACAFMDDFCQWVWLHGPTLSQYAETVTVDPTWTNNAGVNLDLVSISIPVTLRSGRTGYRSDEIYRGGVNGTEKTYFYAAEPTDVYATYNADLSVPRFSIYFYNTTSTAVGWCTYSTYYNQYVGGSMSTTGSTIPYKLCSWGGNTYNSKWSFMLPYSMGTMPDPLDLGDFEESGSTQPVGNPDLFAGLSSLSVNPSDFVTVQQPEGDGWQVAPSEWLRVVTDIVSGNDQTTMTVTQDDTGVTQHVVVRPSDLPSVPGDPVQPAPEINPTVPDTTVPTFDLPDITGDWNGTSAYEVNIRDLFPFCIPFDVLDICQLFAAEPVAPAFEIPIKSEAYGIDETVEFDLSPFDGVASTVRTLEKVAFLVGLALVTKNLLGG